MMIVYRILIKNDINIRQYNKSTFITLKINKIIKIINKIKIKIISHVIFKIITSGF